MLMLAHDAWSLARLLHGNAAEGEAGTVSAPFRALAERLASLHLEQRQATWEGFLCGRPDRDALVKAVADADPWGSAPEVGEPGADAWGPLRLAALPRAIPFPLDVLPEPAARLAIEGASAIGCPPDFLALPMLAVAGRTIGRSVSLRLKHRYFAGPVLFAACVGPPSDGKTPAFKMVTEAVRRIDAALAAEHAQAMLRWEESNLPGPNNQKPKATPQPRPRRIDVDDITMEAVPMRLADNPRGLIMLRDELTALFLGLNQYKGGKGNDRSIVLKIWSGDAIKKDRVSDVAGVPIRCEHPCMPIFGRLPPAMLGSAQDAKGSADGLVDRFLFSYPEPLPVPDWSSDGVSDEVAEGWGDLVARLWERPMRVHDGKDVPHVARFTHEGEASWSAYFAAHSAEMNAPEFPPAMRGPWGKLREYAGRFALILACLDHAADPTLKPAGVPDVGPRAVEGAWRLVAYFKNHAERVHMTISSGTGIGGSPTAKAIVEWLQEGDRRSFSEHEVKQARRWIQDDELEDALDYLAERNAIRAQAPPKEARKGRPPSGVYDVNPALLDTQNP